MGAAQSEKHSKGLYAMTELWRKICTKGTFLPICACSFAAALTVSVGTLVTSPVAAQSEAVSVDLSVISDGGAAAFGPSSHRGLLIPPRSNPVSVLHVAPQTAPKLRAPVTQANTAPSVRKPATTKMAEAPARAVNAGVDAAKPAVPLAPAPKPMPIKEVAKAEPIAAPPMPEKVAEKKPEPAPAQPEASSAPPPPPKVAAAPEPKAVTEQASTGAQAVEIAPGQALRIAFADTETKLPDAAKDALKKVADGVHDKNDLRLQLMAYAGAEGLSASKARRLSLSRALSVRSFLIENGVRSTRIDVRALGNKTSDKPANRVDINIAKR